MDCVRQETMREDCHRVAFSSHLKSRVGHILDKASSLRIDLNIDDAPIESRLDHTLTSKLSPINLVSIFRCSSSTTNAVCARRVNFLVSVCSLSSIRDR